MLASWPSLTSTEACSISASCGRGRRGGLTPLHAAICSCAQRPLRRAAAFTASVVFSPHERRSHERTERAGRVYRLVIVRLPFANGDVQVLDVTAKLPAMVDVEAVVTVMVPPIWPEHAGAAGMLPGPTEIVYGSTAPLILPVKNPFSSTMPLASVTNTGPVTELSACCVSIHLICAWPPCALRSPIHVPVTLT